MAQNGLKRKRRRLRLVSGEAERAENKRSGPSAFPLTAMCCFFERFFLFFDAAMTSPPDYSAQITLSIRLGATLASSLTLQITKLDPLQCLVQPAQHES
jgi:hypothetical protein